MTTTEEPSTCRHCGRIHPDHREDCPIRVLAESLAEMMSDPAGTVTEVHVTSDLRDVPSGAIVVPHTDQ